MGNTTIKVAIVGTGAIGAGWATHFLAQGFEVMATDPAVGAEVRLREWVDGYWPTVVALGLVDGASRDKLSFTTDLAEAVRHAVFIQEEWLRAQLLDIEFHGEVQMTSRLEAAKAALQSFDPLEFDRFTRFQELTRMMVESVNDVVTVQRSLELTEDELVAQARMTRELQDDLLRTRMVEFEGLSDRLYRVVRQAPFFWLVVIRSAQQRIALHVDEVLGNQEVVVKHLGPKLSRLPPGWWASPCSHRARSS